MATERDVEVLDRNGGDTDIDLELADHEPAGAEHTRRFQVTERVRGTVEDYLGDLREARAMASDPPSLREVLRMLWMSPVVLANHWLLKLLIRVLYFPIAYPVILACYFLIASFVHPARGVLVGSLLAMAVWLWFFS